MVSLISVVMRGQVVSEHQCATAADILGLIDRLRTCAIFIYRRDMFDVHARAKVTNNCDHNLSNLMSCAFKIRLF